MERMYEEWRMMRGKPWVYAVVLRKVCEAAGFAALLRKFYRLRPPSRPHPQISPLLFPYLLPLPKKFSPTPLTNSILRDMMYTMRGGIPWIFS